jgi:glycosyltransferase involved in cell wall biosynthesis
VTILLYRPSLDFTSGAGQLLQMQLLGLLGAGESAEIGCAHGALKFWLRSGTRARRISLAGLRAASRQRFVVDHGLCIPNAAVVFVHNLAIEASTIAQRADWTAQAEAERNFFAKLRPDALIVTNSRLVADAVRAHFEVAAERVLVRHPGFHAARFNPSRAAQLRGAARRELGIAADAPLVGLITSGDFEKRGLDVFIASAERIAAARPDARFLVVGSKSPPAALRGHALAANGRLLHRPKGRRPERWFAALDLFLYPARFEEFGMVVLEAQAVGLPIVTSRRVGAAECLPPAYEGWIADRPDAVELAGRVLALLADRSAWAALSAAGSANAPRYDDRAYAASSAEAILSQKRRLR